MDTMKQVRLTILERKYGSVPAKLALSGPGTTKDQLECSQQVLRYLRYVK